MYVKFVCITIGELFYRFSQLLKLVKITVNVANLMSVMAFERDKLQI